MPAKKTVDETVKLQVVVEQETADKIGKLAERMKVTQSKMCKMLLEAAIEDNEWIINAVTSRFVTAVREALTTAKSKVRKPSTG